MATTGGASHSRRKEEDKKTHIEVREIKTAKTEWRRGERKEEGDGEQK